MLRSTKASLLTAFVMAGLDFGLIGSTILHAAAAAPSGYSEPLNAATLREINGLYRKLIEAENRHDLAAVRAFVWDSPSALFVAKTATPQEGNWAGVLGHRSGHAAPRRPL